MTAVTTVTIDLTDHGITPRQVVVEFTPVTWGTDGARVVAGSASVTTGTDGLATIELAAWLDGVRPVYRVTVRETRACGGGPVLPPFSFEAPAPGASTPLASLLAAALVPDPVPPEYGAGFRADLDRALSGWPYVPIPTVDPVTGGWAPPAWLPLEPSGGVDTRWFNYDGIAGGVPALPLPLTGV